MEQNTVGLQQHFNLKWNNHTNNFLQVFAEHQNQEALVDVTLTCEGHYISAHKLVLSACSDYFRTIFRIHNNAIHPFIILNGIRFKDLKYILNFMYLGEVKVLEHDLPHVLALGENLQVKGLSSVKLVDGNEVKHEHKHREGGHVAPENVKNGENEKISNLNLSLKNVKSESSIVAQNTPHGSIVPNTQRTKVSLNTKEKVEEEPPFKKILLTKPKTNLPSKATNNVQTESTDAKIINQNPTNNTDNIETIPGPPNAFMIFIKEWRDKLMAENPDQDSKSITVLLGNKWKSLSPATKQIYAEAAKKGEEEHRAKFPTYYETSKKRRNPEDSNSTDGFANTSSKRSIINISDDE